MCALLLLNCVGSGKVGPVTRLTTPVTPTDLPKSVLNLYVIAVLAEYVC